KALDDSILEGVIAEDDEPAARPQEVDRGGKPVLECIQLFVDGDPQCLKDAGRGMNPAAPTRRTRRDALDERGELLRGRDGRGSPARDDRPADPGGLWLLAEAAEQRRKLGSVEGRKQLGSGNAA